MEKTLAYLGPEGTFTHSAAVHYQKTNNDKLLLKPFPTIRSSMLSIKNNQSDLCLVPAENSIEGHVNITLDVLAQEDNLYIQSEIVLDIKHYLLSYQNQLENIHTVISHPQALAQCQLFLQSSLSHARILEAESTASAVKQLLTEKDGWAAIGPVDCYKNYQVPIIKEDIGDYPENQTRFILVGNKPNLTKSEKTSLVLALNDDRPGGLYNILEEFTKQNINLSRIESRPTKKKLGKYLFFIDCEIGGFDNRLEQILDALQSKTSLLKNLGSYRTQIGG